MFVQYTTRGLRAEYGLDGAKPEASGSEAWAVVRRNLRFFKLLSIGIKA
jgi:hypothetical protein